jgi:hypothetical protein
MLRRVKNAYEPAKLPSFLCFWPTTNVRKPRNRVYQGNTGGSLVAKKKKEQPKLLLKSTLTLASLCLQCLQQREEEVAVVCC